jgi:uncharacterized protein YcfL
MNNLRSQRNIDGIICWTLLVAILVLFSSCKSGEKAETQEKAEKTKTEVMEVLSVQKLVPIFGEASGETSGISDVSQTQEKLLINYHFYTVDLSQFDEEIGIDLAPKIQKFYEEFKGPNRVAFEVYVPTSGEDLWKQYAFFSVTRKLIEETNWTDFLMSDFLRVVEGLKYYD